MRVLALAPRRLICVLLVFVLALLVPGSLQSGVSEHSNFPAREERYDEAAHAIIRAPFPGLDLKYVGGRGLGATLLRRDCQANQTSCSGSSSHCCEGSTPTCCGSGCCAGGEVCNNGECSLPVITTTITRTVVSTRTNIATALQSVQLEVDDTSTINSVVTVTASNIATAVNVFYTTTTVAAKRGLPTDAASLQRRNVGGNVNGLSSLWSRLMGREEESGGVNEEAITSPFDPRLEPVPLKNQIEARAAEYAELFARSASTVTTTVTSTSIEDTTSTVSTTSTHLWTSMALTTVIRTETSVLNAQATISTTSTITEKSNVPITQTHTAVVTIVPAAHGGSSTDDSSSATSTALTSETQSPGGSGHPLSTGGLVGASFGVGVAGILLITAGIFAWRIIRRKRQARADAFAADPYLADGPGARQTSAMLPCSESEKQMAETPVNEPVVGQFTRAPRRASGIASSYDSSSMSRAMSKTYQPPIRTGRDRSSTSGTYTYVSVGNTNVNPMPWMSPGSHGRQPSSGTNSSAGGSTLGHSSNNEGRAW